MECGVLASTVRSPSRECACGVFCKGQFYFIAKPKVLTCGFLTPRAPTKHTHTHTHTHTHFFRKKHALARWGAYSRKNTSTLGRGRTAPPAPPRRAARGRAHTASATPTRSPRPELAARVHPRSSARQAAGGGGTVDSPRLLPTMAGSPVCLPAHAISVKAAISRTMFL